MTDAKIITIKEKLKSIKFFKSDFMYSLVFIFFALLIEIVGFLWLGLGILPKYVLFDFGIILLIAGIIFVVPSKKAKNILLYLFLIIPLIINCANASLYMMFGDIFYFNLLVLAAEAGTVFNVTFIDWYSVLVHVGIVISLIVLVSYLNKTVIFPNKTQRKKRFSVLIGLFIAIESCGLSLLYAARQNLYDVSEDNDLYIAESDAYLYDNLTLKMKSYENFGLWGFYSKEIVNFFDNLSVNDLSDEDEDELIDYIVDGQVDTNEDALLYGDNLIVIMCESLEWFAIDPIYTPNLYNFFYNDSVSLTNYYSKHKTNVSEGIAILGNMPNETNLTKCIESSYGLDLSYSLPNLFKDDGADTANFFHTYNSSFYNRKTVNSAMGFDNIYTIDNTDVGYETSWHDFATDSDFLSANLENMVPTNGERFMSFFTTVKTHGPYDGHFTNLEDEWETYNDATLYSEFLNWVNSETNFYIPEIGTTDWTYFSNYKVAAMDLDNALGILQTYLAENDLTDDTTIIMYGDHNAYINDLGFTINQLERSNAYDSAPYNIPCAIYSTKLEAQNYTNYCGVYDLYPTICDLFGLAYNSNLTQGYSIFSDEIANAITVSYICGIFTDKLYTRNIDEVYVCTSDPVSEEEIYNFKMEAVGFYARQEKIDKIYEYNLLSKIFT